MATDDHANGNLKRLYLWTSYRSLGTIFLKWLSNLEDSQIINGIFTSCYFYGDEYKGPSDKRDKGNELSKETDLSEFPLIYDGSDCTYSWAKTQLECDYPGKKFLICKDLPFSLCGDHDLIPKGFRHTFLIRHPFRVFLSWKAMFGKVFGRWFPGESLTEIFDKRLNKHYTYKEQYELLRYLQDHPEEGDSNPIIIDADDLLNNPARILSQYCQAIGIPYTDEMLHWKPGCNLVKNWKISRQLCGGGLNAGEWGYYKTAIESSHFMPPKKLPERNELDEDVLACADIVMPFYDMMYNMRTIRP